MCVCCVCVCVHTHRRAHVDTHAGGNCVPRMSFVSDLPRRARKENSRFPCPHTCWCGILMAWLLFYSMYENKLLLMLKKLGEQVSRQIISFECMHRWASWLDFSDDIWACCEFLHFLDAAGALVLWGLGIEFIGKISNSFQHTFGYMWYLLY